VGALFIESHAIFGFASMYPDITRPIPLPH